LTLAAAVGPRISSGTSGASTLISSGRPYAGGSLLAGNRLMCGSGASAAPDAGLGFASGSVGRAPDGP